MFSRILAATDGSPTATLAVAHAAYMARALSARLSIAHVHASDTSGPELLARSGRGSDAAIARAILRDAARRFGTGLDVELLAEAGRPVDALLDLAEEGEHDLIVIGNVGMANGSHLRRAFADRVSHVAPCAVLIVDTVAGREPEYRRILVGTDGSPTASAAVVTAVVLGRRLGGKVTVASAGRPDETQVVLDAVSSRFEEVTLRALSGPPDAALAALCEQEAIDLVVVGNRGMESSGWLRRAVPDRVAHRSPTSVLIADTRQPAVAAARADRWS